ncbi:MAG TPA: Rne/Rng family ribonuclease, partial [Alphaproteobacteria bacterium]|nr:Rne/Rng family ribonuclease [Alphaproteobacteria bacterium]
MTQELLINVSPRETRIALVSQGHLRELFIEREEHRSLVGNVYLGRVTKILAGANAAFVDCGLERSAFLVANDARPPGDFQNNRMDISDLVQEGAEVIVQVIKEPIGDKGARVRSRIALAGRYLVLIPDGDKVNISRRLTDIEERARLTTLIEGAIEPGDGVIIRTVSQGVESEDLANDLLSLKECWSDIQAASDQTDAPSCIHAELDLVLRILRDRLSISIDAVFIDDRAIFSSAQDFCKRFMPTLA